MTQLRQQQPQQRLNERKLYLFFFNVENILCYFYGIKNNNFKLNILMND